MVSYGNSRTNAEFPMQSSPMHNNAKFNTLYSAGKYSYSRSIFCMYRIFGGFECDCLYKYYCCTYNYTL